jgi:hypothetical protein
MRIAITCLAALALAACAGSPRAGQGDDTIPTLEVRSPRQVRVFVGQVPRCGFREVDRVANGPYRQMREEAFRLRANALILQSYGSDQAIAVQFTSPGCQY